jgi:hypothetical protein
LPKAVAAKVIKDGVKVSQAVGRLRIRIWRMLYS